MPHQSDRLHVQKNRLASRAGIGHRFCASAQGIVQVRAIAADIMQRWSLREIRRDPPARRTYLNTDAVILTQEDYWHRQMLIGGPAGGVECALRCGMICRRITKRT